MCSISGYFSTKKSGIAQAKATISTLLKEGEWRGHDATGIGFFHQIKTKKTAIIVKSGITALRFIETPEFKKYIESDTFLPQSMLAHTRAHTKGDPKHNANNHPLYSNGIMLIHNGIISNDDALFEQYQLKRDAEVDTEILVKLIDHFHNTMNLSMVDSIKKLFMDISGSAAIAVIDKDDPGSLYLAKNNNPIYTIYQKSTGIIWFASTELMLKDSVMGKKLFLNWFLEKDDHDYIIKEVPVNTLVHITAKDIQTHELDIHREIYRPILPAGKAWSPYTPILKPGKCKTEQLEDRLDIFDKWIKNKTPFTPAEIQEKARIESTLYDRYKEEDARITQAKKMHHLPSTAHDVIVEAHIAEYLRGTREDLTDDEWMQFYGKNRNYETEN